MDQFVEIWRLLTQLAASVIGLRLLQVARRTRGLPELIFGVAILLPCVGTVLHEVVLAQGPSLAPEQLVALRALTAAIFVLGPLGLYLGTWLIFRRGRRWAALLCATASVVLLAAPVLRIIAGPQGSAEPALVVVVVFGGAYTWTAIEALLYFRQMRRRAKLGLGDAVTTMQFLLWGISSSCGAISVFATFATIMVLGQRVSQVPAVSVLAPAVAGIWIVCLYLAFFPPVYLQEFLERRTATRGA